MSEVKDKYAIAIMQDTIDVLAKHRDDYKSEVARLKGIIEGLPCEREPDNKETCIQAGYSDGMMCWACRAKKQMEGIV